MLKRLLLLFMGKFKGGVWFAREIGVHVGEGCRIYTTQFGSEPFLISIGANVTVTSGVRFVTHDGATWLVRDGRGRRYRYSPIVVGDEVFIGVNSILMPGVEIGSRSIIGAGSVVTRSIPENSIAVGVPARVIGKFEEYFSKAIEEFVAEQDLPKKGEMSYEAWISAYFDACKKND